MRQRVHIAPYHHHGNGEIDPRVDQRNAPEVVIQTDLIHHDVIGDQKRIGGNKQPQRKEKRNGTLAAKAVHEAIGRHRGDGYVQDCCNRSHKYCVEQIQKHRMAAQNSRIVAKTEGSGDGEGFAKQFHVGPEGRNDEPEEWNNHDYQYQPQKSVHRNAAGRQFPLHCTSHSSLCSRVTTSMSKTPSRMVTRPAAMETP